MSETIKIFISYHKESEKLESGIMIPVHAGARQSSLNLDMIGDDEGDNISCKNDRYCELTAQYWAWKNTEADYYGFMQYKRHFVFREIPDVVEADGVTIMPSLDEEYKQKIGLNDSEIHKCVDGYDVILPMAVDVTLLGGISNEVQFSMADNLHARDFDLMCQTILELYPDYAKAVFDFRNGKYAYWYNMFIMKREIFHDYCSWLFHILENLEEKIDFTYFTEQEMQTLRFISQRLLSIYMIRLLDKKPDLKIKHLKVTYVKDTDKRQEIWPAFEKNNIAVAVSCNEYYMPILGVMLSTMLKCGSSKNNYDILVLYDKSVLKGEGVEKNAGLLEKLAGGYANASLRFVDVSRLTGGRVFFVRGNFTPEAYFRLFLPQILNHYEKVLYLDADMIVCHDVAELYRTDLEGMLLGAVRDPVISGSDKVPLSVYNRRDYIAKLGVKNIYDYFQSGVMLIDLKKMSEDGLCDRMVEYAATHDCALVDQDVLNVFCQERVKFIDNRWNVDVNVAAMKIVPYAPAAMWKQYVENRKNAYIYHFAGAHKPWKDPSLDKAEIFWDAARKTPWYEIILKGLMDSAVFLQCSTEVRNGFGSEILPVIRAYNELSGLGSSKVESKITKRKGNLYKLLTEGKQVIFYGGGYGCRQILLYFDELGLPYPVEIWDREAKQGKRLFGVPLCRPDFKSLKGRNDVLCIITIESKAVYESVKLSFAEQGFKNVIGNSEIMKILAEEIWIKLEEDHKG